MDVCRMPPWLRVGLCFAVFLVSTLPSYASAIPRFAARTGADCSKCHVNPTGGGPRTRYGRNVFERQFLPVDWGDAVDTDIGADTELGFGDDAFSAAIGGDLRGAYLFTRPGDRSPTNPGMNTFFLMQADLYVTAELTDYVTLSLDYGKSRIEAFGMLHTAAKDLWLKIGQFVMPYGLRYANHRVFVRELTGFNPAGDYRGLDTGIESGASLGPFNLIAAVANGKPPGGTSGLDDNDSKALYAKVEYILGGDGPKLRTGLSGALNTAGRQVITSEGGSRRLIEDSRIFNRQAGLYLAGSLGRFSYLGEVNVTQQVDYSTDADSLETTTDEQLGYNSFQELSFLAIQGLDLQAIFEYSDPSLNYTGRSITRVGGGFEFFPFPMVEWKVLYRHTFARDVPTDGTDELFTYLHFFL